jgi:tRNA(fMet)-specific endonuclease VapC
VIILDTDHIVTLKHENDPHWNTLTTNLVSSADQDFATTAITVEEQNRGWLALINRYTDVHKQIPAYARLIELIRFFAAWRIMAFDEAAANEFVRLRKERIRIGTHDLKIASIALVHDATLLSANLRDFEQVPGLCVENWLE